MDLNSDKTEPNVGCPFDPKVYILLVNEEEERKELVSTIKKVQDCKVPEEMFVETIEQLLIDMQEYMTDVKELTDLLKQG